MLLFRLPFQMERFEGIWLLAPDFKSKLKKHKKQTKNKQKPSKHKNKIKKQTKHKPKTSKKTSRIQT